VSVRKSSTHPAAASSPPSCHHRRATPRVSRATFFAHGTDRTGALRRAAGAATHRRLPPRLPPVGADRPSTPSGAGPGPRPCRWGRGQWLASKLDGKPSAGSNPALRRSDPWWSAGRGCCLAGPPGNATTPRSHFDAPGGPDGERPRQKKPGRAGTAGPQPRRPRAAAITDGTPGSAYAIGRRPVLPRLLRGKGAAGWRGGRRGSARMAHRGGRVPDGAEGPESTPPTRVGPGVESERAGPGAAHVGRRRCSAGDMVSRAARGFGSPRPPSRRSPRGRRQKLLAGRPNGPAHRGDSRWAAGTTHVTRAPTKGRPPPKTSPASPNGLQGALADGARPGVEKRPVVVAVTEFGRTVRDVNGAYGRHRSRPRLDGCWSWAARCAAQGARHGPRTRPARGETRGLGARRHRQPGAGAEGACCEPFSAIDGCGRLDRASFPGNAPGTPGRSTVLVCGL